MNAKGSDMSIAVPKSHAAVAHFAAVPADADVILHGGMGGPTAADDEGSRAQDSPDSPEEAIMPASERPEHWEDLEDPSDEPLYRPTEVSTVRFPLDCLSSSHCSYHSTSEAGHCSLLHPPRVDFTALASMIASENVATRSRFLQLLLSV